MTARRFDAVLAALWLALMAAAIARAWPVGFVAFFAFAAGERWQSYWTRDGGRRIERRVQALECRLHHAKPSVVLASRVTDLEAIAAELYTGNPKTRSGGES